MKITHIITRLIIGGAQENTLLSCQGQHDLGHDVTLITGPALGPEGSLLERAQSHGYRVIVLGEMRRAIHPFRDFRIYKNLIRLLKEQKPDIVHTHSSKAGIIGRWAAHRAGIPSIVHTIHGLAFTASTSSAVNRVYKSLEKHTAPISTKIICVADAMRDQSLAAGIGKPEQYITIYSGMLTAPFLNPAVPREQTRSSLGLAPYTIVVGTIARLFDLKGHDDLLQIAPDLCQKFTNLRFLWLGDGTLRPHLESEMSRLNLRDRFILTGMVPPARVPELTAAMDILVHPSRREGLARALPQAALAAIPTVAYDIDGNREGLQDQITGLIIPPFDISKLKDAIQSLLSDADLRKKMGTAGRQFALSRFDAPVMIAALEKTYKSITQKTT
jgi:glycosyltransferase involved in cell wall biosynthesis